jgi:putative ABC transport system ATP-binding protein
MIELTDVQLRLSSPAGAVHILRGIELSISDGDAVSVVGPSGSGKSSLLSIIGGIERTTSGRVTVGGQDLTTLDEDGLALFRREHIGILFQAFHLIPTMSAVENVALPLELAGEPDAMSRAAEALVEVGLGERTTHYPGQLSGGEQQRVALARAMINEPSLLLADEPTGNLDADTGRDILDLIFRLRDRRGTTLFLITHDSEVARRCPRRFRMDRGRIEELAPEQAPLVPA